MEFKETIFNDLINSEGANLQLVESVDEDEMENIRLYLKAKCLKGQANIYCKVNQSALEMFFQGRLSVKELFLLRIDEDYIIEYKGRKEALICDEDFIYTVIDSIECGNNHYDTLAQTMREVSPFDSILNIVKRDYINAMMTVPGDKLFGRKWLINNGLL